MPHRRKGRRLSLVPLDPALRLTLLKLTRAPRHLIARAARANTRSELEALLDPCRRRPPSGRTPRVAPVKRAGMVG